MQAGGISDLMKLVLAEVVAEGGMRNIHIWRLDSKLFECFWLFGWKC
jgi:hypothetical protein